MTRFTIAVALVATLMTSKVAQALPGPAAPGTTIGEYNPATGQIVVSGNGVNNWWVEDFGFAAMTGDAPAGLPVAGGIVTDNDFRIGESTIAVFSFTDLNLGECCPDRSAERR